jgi:hypothetical protein
MNKFKEWFNEVELYGLRSERFYDSLTQFKSQEALYANMLLWLEAAYKQGADDFKKELK